MTTPAFRIELSKLESGGRQKVKVSRRSTPSVISLFSGAGGLDTGLEAAGFRIKLAVERDAACCATLRINHRWKVLETSLEKTTPQELLKNASLRRRQVDLIAAGPPCQPFSKSANWSPSGPRRLRDPRAATLHNLVEVIDHILPRCVLIENVEGFRRGGIRFLRAGFRKINKRSGVNYQATWAVLNAADYGVPQTRRRLILVAFRDGRTFKFPEATHAGCPTTCWDAIGEFAKKRRRDLAVRGRWAGLLPSIPEGRNYLWHTNRGGGQRLFGWRTKYWSFLLKLAKNQPSWTIPAQPAQNAGPFHWSNRQLRTAELLRLQTFPSHFFVSGSRQERQRQIGNAVPPLLAEVIGRAIIASLKGKSIRKRPYNLAIRRQKAAPRPARVSSPNKRYLHMAGRHEDHPGTGLGPAGRPH